jgi:(S)-2-hydroxyglutarate dehydrogenase
VSERTIGIVGGGIVGLAIARELGRRRPGLRVVVFEKEERLGAHQTGHNSGVVHAGIYYPPGSLKARLCARGRMLLRDYCRHNAIPFEECGKLVVAVDGSEVARLEALERTARANNVPGLRRLDAAGLIDVEPHARGVAALHSPATAITDYVAVARALGAEVEASGGSILLSTQVTGVVPTGRRIRLRCGEAAHDVDRVVLCAGLQADRVSALAGAYDGPRIVPFRGDYMAVRPEKRDLVRGMVYPVPDPRYPFLGVHFTRRVSGDLEVGPNAVLALQREGYGRSDVSFRDVRSMAAWPGFWRMARTHWRTGAHELGASLSVRAYMQAAQRYVPEIGPDDVVRARAGVRAQAVDRDGSLVDDFRIVETGGVTSVVNAPSPAATSSLAIAEHVLDTIDIDL